MRTSTTPQDRSTVTPREGNSNQSRAAKAPSKRTSPIAATGTEAPATVKPKSAEQQPATRKDDNRGRRAVRFALRSPNARSVALAGSFNGWQPVTRLAQSDGQWVADVNLEPGTYEYRFVVDGQWIEDPAASAHATNPYGGRNSVVKV